MMEVKCSHCGTVNSDKNNSCWSCGKPLWASSGAPGMDKFVGRSASRAGNGALSEPLPVAIRVLRGFAWTMLVIAAFVGVVTLFAALNGEKDSGSILPGVLGALFASVLTFAFAGVWESSERTRRALERIEKILGRKS